MKPLAALTLSAVALLATSCAGDDEPVDTDTDTVGPPSACETLGLPERAFDAEAVAGTHRREMAADFTIERQNGETWSLAESWTGCDSYVIVPHGLSISSNKPQSWWTTGTAELVARSPKNAVYIFIPRGSTIPETGDLVEAMQADVDATLAALPEEEAAWWQDRLIVADRRAFDIGNWATDLLRSDVGDFGFGIDRFQRIRGLGGFGDVESYDGSAQWPFEYQLYSLANETHYFNYEAERQAELDAVDATIVEGLGGDVIEQFEDFEVTLPDAATMKTFDTLEFDVLMECPDPDKAEVNNCGAWDYLAHMWLYEGEGEDATRVEMARFITTYHRESRWVVDASQALAWLQEGGTRRMRYEWAPSWNTQPTGVTVKIRLSNQGKGVRPVSAQPLFQGGTLDGSYNDNRPPVEVEVPDGADKVELWAIITGHGADTNLQCSEFCNHGHTFNVGSHELYQNYPEANDRTACRDDVPNGTVPNQNGTWWFGRAGWCPGREVYPWVSDVTEHVTPGSPVTVSYAADIEGRSPTTKSGNIRLSSWLVAYEEM